MKDFERKQLLERLDRDGATIGVDLPDSLEVGGEEVALREFVFETERRETVSPQVRERVETAKRNLRRERRRRRERIEEGSVSFETGEDLAASILGIDRALAALDQLETVDVEAEAEARKAADRKRWLRFLRKALGEEPVESGVGRTGR